MRDTLTPYQRATADHLCEVCKSHNVYLVADEVGLGKTWVAKGLIERLGARRVIYVASNSLISRQNGKALVLGTGGELLDKADRLSLLEAHYPALSPKRLLILPLSPATTFTGRGSSIGNGKERGFYAARLAGMQRSLRDPEIPLLLKKPRERMSGEEAERLKSYIPALRRYFNDAAVARFDPDLIILDEFHRFHDLLNKESDADYSMFGMLEKLTAARLESGRPPVRLLLLSATPYRMRAMQEAEKTVHAYEKQDEERQEQDPSAPFADLGRLRGYMAQLDRAGMPDTAPDRQGEERGGGLYGHILCRTERGQLLAGLAPTEPRELLPLPPSTESTGITPLLTGHLRYRTGYQREALGSQAPGSPQANAADQIGIMAGVLGSPSALAPYARLRSYLDEAPEFLQFADRYRAILGRAGADEARVGFSKRLAESGYRIRRGPADEPEPERFGRVRGHYKFSLLLGHAMPKNCELLLWVPPTLPGPAARETLKTLGLAGFGKTLVFAHYRMSTRSAAALSSMEAQLRLLARMDGREPLGGSLDEETLDRLLEPVQSWPGLPAQCRACLGQKRTESCPANPPDLCAGYWKALKNAVRVFFGTTHARRVLTAYFAGRTNAPGAPGSADTPGTFGAAGAAGAPGALNAAVPQYCAGMGWAEMLWEYLDCLNSLGPQAAPDDIPGLLAQLAGVLDWTDADRTRVLVLPDWGGQNENDPGYPCTFGERYTPDYSDKSAHDEGPGTGGDGKRVTARRLGCIMDRFQSPFYPFVLAASETAQEGVNLHSYCRTLFHWSVPSSLNALIQEEGRVDRRGSLTIRRQMAWLWQRALETPSGGSLPQPSPGGDRVAALFGSAEEICTALAADQKAARTIREAAALGLFPLWQLPAQDAEDFPRPERLLAALPMSREREEFKQLLAMQKKYGSFGLDEAREPLCPLLRLQKAAGPDRDPAARREKSLTE